MILELFEYNCFLKGIFSWVGFKIEYIEFKNWEWIVGEIFWFFWSLLSYLIDGIVNFLEILLNIVLYVGVFLCIGFVLVMLVIIFWILVNGDLISGWFLMVCIVFFVGGL